MKLSFTKMQGAGNDFVVLDETQGLLGLSAAQYRWLADRRFGVGADQILTVRAAPPAQAGQVDFEYIIHNADGGEVEQCGNGARCFARYVFDKGLTHKKQIRVLTRAGIIAPQLQDDGRVTVRMGCPRWQPGQIPFDAQGLRSQAQHQDTLWWLPLEPSELLEPPAAGAQREQGAGVWLSVVSMGNPHAVQRVASVQDAPVAVQGAWIERHPRFAQRVNAGFMQVRSRSEIALRVYERGVGETLACGTGACAAVVSGIRQGLLDTCVDVHMPGGMLTIEWQGGPADEVLMTGPAQTVFEGTIEIADSL
ncbi:diaminopimelate epimerase [Vandammella animalimorsus]|uniref:Diaminopimelate epimerase n=1 Tax=Vandammella animalimorsus TaxID=2029117 RepID=A0A2A2ACZ1_9BURK|nr:diaminopimelate epimerase [Vandammella animalimorsus]PAT35618.1 diaminopimelate epimerase [Vandammella animalimorsus]